MRCTNGLSKYEGDEAWVVLQKNIFTLPFRLAQKSTDLPREIEYDLIARYYKLILFSRRLWYRVISDYRREAAETCALLR